MKIKVYETLQKRAPYNGLEAGFVEDLREDGDHILTIHYNLIVKPNIQRHYFCSCGHQYSYYQQAAETAYDEETSEPSFANKIKKCRAISYYPPIIGPADDYHKSLAIAFQKEKTKQFHMSVKEGLIKVPADFEKGKRQKIVQRPSGTYQGKGYGRR